MCWVEEPFKYHRNTWGNARIMKGKVIMSVLKKYFLFFLLNILLLVFISPGQAMERRRDQFMKEPAHYLVPVPISYPGIGEGFAAIGRSEERRVGKECRL